MSNSMRSMFAMDKVPERYRKGPWSPLTSFFVASFPVGWIWYGVPWAFNDLPQLSSNVASHWTISVLFGVYGLCILAMLVKQMGWWPFSTFTVISWSVFTLRNIFAVLAIWFDGKSLAIQWIAELIKFPMLAMNSITVIVWWLGLLPAILFYLPVKYRKAFFKFNMSFVMLNIHGFNLILAIAEFWFNPRKFTNLDLFIGITIGYAYLLFYLLCLDAKGMHLYIILTPRVHTAPLVYALMLGIVWAVFQFWNTIVDRFMQ